MSRPCLPFIRAALVAALLLTGGLFFSGCQTRSPFPPVDLSQPGWKQRQYQVVWHGGSDGNEMVCDVIEAWNADGKRFLQVSKTPVVLATVQAESAHWWVKYGPRPRSATGYSAPDAAHLWVLIALKEKNAPSLEIKVMPNQTERWSNTKTGEWIEGVPQS